MSHLSCITGCFDLLNFPNMAKAPRKQSNVHCVKARSVVAKAPWKDLWKHHVSTMKYNNDFEHRSAVDAPLGWYEQIKYSYVPRTRIGRIFAIQNNNKIITKLTRQPTSNTITHWSLCQGDASQTISLMCLNCVQEGQKERWENLFWKHWLPWLFSTGRKSKTEFT